MMHTVEDDLRDRSLAINTFAGSFVIGRLGETCDGPIAVRGICVKHEPRCRRVWAANERSIGIFLRRFLR
jgi:hypothetical protein